MDAWQVIQEVRDRFQRATWSDSTRIIGSVAIGPAAPDAWTAQGALLPAVVLNLSGERGDDEEPDLVWARITGTLITSAPSDAMAEGALLGAGRTTDTGQSGRGMMEVWPKIRPLCTGLGNVGVRAVMRSTSAAQVVRVQDIGHVATRSFELEALCGADRTYAAATRFAASVSGSTVTLSWRLPATRWDLLRMVLRRASGATPPAGPTDGTGVTLGSDLPSSTTDSPGAGTWSYSLFAAYDDYPVSAIVGPAWLEPATPTTARSYSPAASVASVTV